MIFSFIKKVLNNIILRIKNLHANVRFYGLCNIMSGTRFEGNNKIWKSKILGGYIGFGTYISYNCELNAKIGRFCSIGQNVVVAQGKHPTSKFVSTHPAFFSNKKQAGFTFCRDTIFNELIYADSVNNFDIIIGNDVWIGRNVIILPGVRIGDGSIIGTGAVVTKDIEPYAIVAGNPARILKYRFPKSEIDFLLEFKWWEKDFAWISKNYYLFNDINKFKERFFDEISN